MNSNSNNDCQQGVNNPVDNLSVTLLAEVEEQLAIEEALADFDLPDDDPQPAAHVPAFMTAMSEWQEKRTAGKAKNKVLGHVAQAFDEIDEYRKTPEGKEGRKLTRKEKRHQKALAAGRTIKPRRSNLTKDERDEANAERQARHRAKLPVSEQSKTRQDRRAAAREREAAEAARQRQAMLDRAIF
ncbi:hypothetical protein [Sinorhizobium meliloti]|uniref:hypothetical protein n=1 Tax=Rhizobium meliloti TaxID=382 RepID=UPI000FD7F127|nr:hypothetical protein [Sinorhizobium meliloti]RVG95997.1 hypothetical protein CN218_08105 [Sinorhizobium meliloti]WQP07811.1 hypothetical protein U8C39_19495 [Sinorhizobium meliloti]WQP21216.1 hypothetical protein U8C33_19625 [Sinorhizobium meliloti]WQP34631.1 hypothetical protein U8C45_19450 [Sinorhizobium meliloti]